MPRQFPAYIDLAWDRHRRAVKGCQVQNPALDWRTWKTHGKEDPLEHLAVIFWLFRHIEPQFVFGVVVLREVKYDSSGLEDRETFRSCRGRSIPVH